MSGSRNLKVLDCTIRDGGYYNDWDFDLADVQEYIHAMARGNVDIVEIGFRFTPKAQFLGPFAYTTEDLLAQLTLPEGIEFGVMINASDYLNDDWKQALERSFVECSNSHVSLVRIAAHLKQIPECDKLVAWLKNAGYKVGLNLMQISQATDDEIKTLVSEIEANFVDFDALYFADSLGNLVGKDIDRIVAIFKENTTKPIGFHGHDNIGLGVRNSLSAIDAGAEWIDATVTGMGRGAGNTQTEYLALELNSRGLHEFNMLDIQKVATGWLADLKVACGWGTNVYYYEAGLRSLHPSYVQQMLSSQKYEPIDILVMIEALGGQPTPNSYKEANIEFALSNMLKAEKGACSITNQWNDRPVMLVANGAAAARHWNAAKAHAAEMGAVVVSLNHVSYASPDDFDCSACIHPARMMHLLDQPDWDDVPVYTSVHSFPGRISARLQSRANIKDYGVSVERGQPFKTFSDTCEIPEPQVLAYAWAIAIESGCSEILLAGFDGYDGRSHAYVETAKLLEGLIASSNVKVSALTKTHYDVPLAAVYAS